MFQRPAFPLLLLALLAALWQPLCLCRSSGGGSKASSATQGCCEEQRAPRPSAPCERHDGECGCGTKLALAPVEVAGTGGIGGTVHTGEVTFAFLLELPAYLPGSSATAELVPTAVPIGRPPAPPGSARRLPLRI